MEFGESWYSSWVASENFGGMFLEYHNDQPHFHMAYEEGGSYILAKWSDETKQKLHITAFELSPMQGVYTKKGAIHNDNMVKGKLLIGYSITRDFSVAFLRNTPEVEKMVEVHLHETP